MVITDQHDVVQQLLGTIVSAEVGKDEDGIHLQYEDGRYVILTGIVVAMIGNRRKALQ